MSTYHVTHERLKRQTSLTGVNGDSGSTITIHHRIQVVDGRIKSPISGKMKDLASVTAVTGMTKTFNMPGINGAALGSGVLHIMLPAINRDAFHTTDWHRSINALS